MTSKHTASGYSTVLVVWADAHCGNAGWQEMTDYEDDGEYLIETVGFLVPEGNPGSKSEHVTVWQTINEDEAIHPFHIPSAMVRKIVELLPVVVPGVPDRPVISPLD
jgi:hypothetical protein